MVAMRYPLVRSLAVIFAFIHKIAAPSVIFQRTRIVRSTSHRLKRRSVAVGALAGSEMIAAGATIGERRIREKKRPSQRARCSVIGIKLTLLPGG
jgi:hypothetical protein